MDPRTQCFGVDIGKKGAIVHLDLEGTVVYRTDMYPDDDELTHYWQVIANAHYPVQIVVEKVWSNPKWGRRHCFEFGRQKGRAECAITAAGLSFYRITPTGWQGHFGMKKTPFERSGSKGQTAWKKRLQRKAIEIFDGSVTQSRADAYLIAEYCRQRTLEEWV